MSFAFPFALLLAALAIPIAGLYVLKVRLRRQPVSTNLFWKQIFDEKPPRSLFQTLRHLLSLLAQLLILGLLVLAVADPYLPWQVMQAHRVVLVIDNSASMQATDVQGTRLQAAKDRAQDFISGMREQDQAAIVLAGCAPEVLVGMTSHLPTLRRQIDAVAASDHSTYLDSAIELGQQLVGKHPHGRVVVFTDGCAEPKASEEHPNPIESGVAPIEWQIVSTKANNVGITQFQARRSFIDPMGYELLTSVWNASAVDIRCRLEITLADVPIDVLPLELKADEHWQRSLEKTSIEGGVLRATLTEVAANRETTNDDEDESDKAQQTPLNRLATDDVASAILPTRSMQKVLIVTPGNLFLQKVFEANPLVDLELRQTFPEVWPSDTIVVLHRDVPSTLPDGNVFVVDPEADCDAWTVGGVLDHPLITELDEASSLMTHIRLDNVLVPEARELKFTKPAKLLAGTVTEHAIYADVEREHGRCLVLSVNLEQSDLAFRTAFPIMVTNALTWYARQSGEIDRSLATGSLVQIDFDELPPQPSLEEPSTYRFVSPSGASTTLSRGADVVSVGPLGHSGVWKLQDAEGQNTFRQIAVNLTNERETDLRTHKSLDQQTRTSGLTGSWFNRPIWFYLALIVAGLITLEWFLYQRRLIT